MVLISQIITEAFRESNNIPIGDQPTAAEQAEGLNLFNRLVRSLIGTEAGDAFTTFYVGNNGVTSGTTRNPSFFPSNYFPPINTRIIFNNEQSQSFSLNPYPQDGERFSVMDASNNFATYPVTIKGNGSLIDGSASVTLSTSGVNKEYFYRSDLASWQTVNPLILTDSLPFPQDFEDMFIIGLAMRINPRNGTQMDPQSIAAYKSLQKKFKARYSVVKMIESEEGLLRTSGVRPYNRRIYTDRFQSGW